MGSLSPLQIVLLIVAALAAIGVTITAIRSRMTLSGYREITGEIGRISGALSADVFRDGSDVVISGAYEGVPAVVRFSNAENTPGLNIRMQAPATFSLAIAPADARVTEGRPVRTGDARFDSYFQTRSDQPTQATMFLTRSNLGLMQRLACSKKTYVSVGPGVVELSELVVPPDSGQHVVDHLKAMRRLNEALYSMPGAHGVKLATFPRERHLAARIAIVVGGVVALGSVFAAVQVPPRKAASAVNATYANGILPVDAIHITKVEGWRVAAMSDMDPVATNWLRGNGRQPEGRVEGDFSGNSSPHDVAYLLVAENGRRRVIIIADNDVRFDSEFAYVGLVARIPKSELSGIRWEGKPPADVIGDGLLLVKQPDDPKSGVVVFLNGNIVISGAPANYQSISLQ